MKDDVKPGHVEVMGSHKRRMIFERGKSKCKVSATSAGAGDSDTGGYMESVDMALVAPRRCARCRPTCSFLKCPLNAAANNRIIMTVSQGRFEFEPPFMRRRYLHKVS